MVVHMLLFTAALLILGNMHGPRTEPADGFTPVNDDLSAKPPLEQMELTAVAPLDTSELNLDDLRNPQFKAQTAQSNDGSATFSESGGGRETVVGPDGGGFGGFNVDANGPGASVRGGGGIGAGHGHGDKTGSGGDDTGFGGRGTGRRQEMLGKFGGTKNTELAVIAALNWFARHRNTNGSWSLSRFSAHCSGNPCTGPGSADSDVAATALSLLTFLAAGETHKTHGPYQPVVNQGIFWLIKHQTHNGNLAVDSPAAQMYAHALGDDHFVRGLWLDEGSKGRRRGRRGGDVHRGGPKSDRPADGVTFRRIPPGGDTSVLGWQIMALHSAQLAGVPVNSLTLENAKRWLGSVCQGTLPRAVFLSRPERSRRRR